MKVSSSINNIVFKFIFFLTPLGYIQYVPYWVSNIIFIIMPIAYIISVKKISFKFLCFYLFWVLISIIPFLWTTVSPMQLVIRLLKVLSPLFAFEIGRSSDFSKNDFIKLCLIGIVVNFTISFLQFTVIPHSLLFIDDNGNAIWKSIDLNIPFYAYRVTGMLGNANANGAYMVLLSCFLISDQRMRNKVLATLLCVLTAFVFSKSRNSFATFIILLLFGSIIRDRSKNLLILVVVMISSLIFILAFDLDKLLIYILRYDGMSKAADYRMQVNITGLKIWWSKFILLGGGIGSEVYYMKEAGSQLVYTECAFIKLLLERGIIGFSLHSFLLAYALFKLKDSYLKLSVFFLLLSIFCISIFETVFYVEELYNFSFLILGVVLSLQNKLNLNNSNLQSGEFS